MKNYRVPDRNLWIGRSSDDLLYLHEKVELITRGHIPIAESNQNIFALLGYSCDAGVTRNQGRAGAMDGPDAIRSTMGGISNHLSSGTRFYDLGNVVCDGDAMEEAQNSVSEIVGELLEKGSFPIVLGGGHDLAYGHFKGIRKAFPDGKIGIINLDAHFDLRKPFDKSNSGTPFYQIAKAEGRDFKYCCLGIQKAANNSKLFQTARKLKAPYLLAEDFTMAQEDLIANLLDLFIEEVDHLYLTIDLDGFSSAIAPGVSAPSPMGFDVDVALFVLGFVARSEKLRSMDIVELNPKFDRDSCTARLAGRLAYAAMLQLQH